MWWAFGWKPQNPIIVKKKLIKIQKIPNSSHICRLCNQDFQFKSKSNWIREPLHIYTVRSNFFPLHFSVTWKTYFFQFITIMQIRATRSCRFDIERDCQQKYESFGLIAGFDACTPLLSIYLFICFHSHDIHPNNPKQEANKNQIVMCSTTTSA